MVPAEPTPDGAPSDVERLRAELRRLKELLDAGNAAEVRKALHHRSWQTGIDLTKLPGMLLEVTDHLLMAAAGCLSDAQNDEARAHIEKAIEFWEDPTTPARTPWV